MTKIANNVKKLKNGPKTPKKWQNFGNLFSSFFWLETTSTNGTSHFHTMFGNIVMHLMSFWDKPAFFGSEFQTNQRNYS